MFYLGGLPQIHNLTGKCAVKSCIPFNNELTNCADHHICQLEAIVAFGIRTNNFGKGTLAIALFALL